MTGKIKITKNGPYLVSGKIPLDTQIVTSDKNGFPEKYVKGKKFETADNFSLCRCGNSKHKPFCDGHHVTTKFNGTETANKEKYLTGAEKIKGKLIDLTDNEQYCFGVGFCHSSKGDVWNLSENADTKEKKKQAIKMACNCTSGRLVAWDKETKKAIETKFTQSISLIQEPAKKVSGPLWIKGNIKIESADGTTFEKRNRVTLCRCGKSQNKPFCDGYHISFGFNDGDKSVSKKKK